MAQIKNLEGLSNDQINMELQKGAKFVVFQYCFSILIMTFKRPTDIYFIKAGESTVKYSIGYTLLTLVFGWWGFPWGPIYTIGSLIKNIGGGKDITQEILHSLNSSAEQNI
jgi:hypothetical protein